MKGIGNAPFREPHWAIRRVPLQNILQEPGKACPKLHGIGGSRFVGGCVDGRVNIIRCQQGSKDQAGLSVCLVQNCKARYTDAVAKHQHRHVYQENNAEAMLRPSQQILTAKSGSLRCQGGHMWASGNFGKNHVQRPGWAYISSLALHII